MQQENITTRVCTALMRIGTRMATGFDQHFADLGITQAQFRILLAVWQQGGQEGITPSALADHLLIERGTVSVLTNRMVDQGWLARKPGKNRRTFWLVLSRAGGQKLREAAPRAIALAERTLAGIPQKEIRQMQANLERIESALRGSHAVTRDD